MRSWYDIAPATVSTHHDFSFELSLNWLERISYEALPWYLGGIGLAQGWSMEEDIWFILVKCLLQILPILISKHCWTLYLYRSPAPGQLISGKAPCLEWLDRYHKYILRTPEKSNSRKKLSLRHSLQICQFKAWIHDNHCDTGQHSQFFSQLIFFIKIEMYV